MPKSSNRNLLRLVNIGLIGLLGKIAEVAKKRMICLERHWQRSDKRTKIRYARDDYWTSKVVPCN